jgi:hypothetical protein
MRNGKDIKKNNKLTQIRREQYKYGANQLDEHGL